MFVCPATIDVPSVEAIDEAHESVIKHNEGCLEFNEEIAWDDVHDKEMDLARIREAPTAQIEYFR